MGNILAEIAAAHEEEELKDPRRQQILKEARELFGSLNQDVYAPFRMKAYEEAMLGGAIKEEAIRAAHCSVGDYKL